MEYKVKGLSDYSEENLIGELQRVDKLLNKNTLSKREFTKYLRVSVQPLHSKFGSFNSALVKAGLNISRLRNITDEDLLQEIERVWNQLGRQPTHIEMRRYGKFCAETYKTHFGSWLKAVEAFVKSKNDNELLVTQKLNKINPEILVTHHQYALRTKKVEYGEPIEFLGLRHAPLNEQGVVYLFGVISRQLGFVIEAVRTDFPDCEGKRKIPGKQDRWERVSIEFEYKSSHFKDHNHNPQECDVIVCWEHDWKDCPLEAISLKEIYNKFAKGAEI